MIRQRWRDLLFVHWAMPVDAVRPLVPPALELDQAEGSAWLTLIPFLIAESRPAALPAILSSAFLETNLRTYVRGPDGEAGIYFFSLEAASLPAVAAARLLYGLPYFFAAMSRRVDGARMTYASRRRTGRGATLEATWTVGEATGPAAAGSLEHFLIERYVLYVRRRSGLRRGRVRHAPYPLRAAAVEGISESLLAAAGLPPPAGPPLCHHSPGVDVEILGLEPVRMPEA
ncbi:MAG: YqjF family protein [Candidatus Rokuibacteriota bacterium]